MNNNVELNNMKESDNMKHCECCNKEFLEEDLTRVKSGELVCGDCLDERYGYCDCCGRYDLLEEFTLTEDGDYVCGDCLNDYYEECEDCNTYHNRDEMRWVNTYNGSGYYICGNCFNRGDYYYCEDCGDLYYMDDMRYCETDGCSYCENCYENHCGDSRIYDWHEHKGDYLDFYKNEDEGEVPYYIGIETESIPNCYDTSSESEFLDALDNNYLPCYYERDSSLGDSGVEIISKPCSPNYIFNHVEGIKKAFDRGIDLGYRSDTDSSAIHIHVSRPSDEVIDRIWLVLETFKDQVLQVARRHSTNYASFLSDVSYGDSTDEDTRKSLWYIKKTKEDKGRYMALNLTNRDTIEFRIFRGTLNYRTWLAYVEFVNNIMIECGNLDKPITEVKWSDLIKGEYISEYVKNRGITCDIQIVDNTAKIVEEENKRNIVINDIKRVLNNYVNNKLIKYVNNIGDSFKIDIDKTRTPREYCGSVMEIVDEYTKVYRAIDNIDNILHYNEWYNTKTFITKIKEFINCEENRADMFKLGKYRISELNKALGKLQ